MPQVRKPAAKAGPKRGAKRPAPTRGRVARKPAGGALQRAGAQADDLLTGLWDRLLTGLAVGTTALGILALFALFAGGYFTDMGARLGALSASAAKTAGFGVARVTVKGADGLTEREVMRALWSDERGSVLGRSIFHVDGAAARARVESLGAVRAAAVVKLWPDTIHVSVSTRRPHALWQDETGGLHVIDEDGVILRPAAPTEHMNLPIVMQADDPAAARDMLAALRRHPGLADEVAAVENVAGRRWNLRFRNEFTAKLPEPVPGADDLDTALARLESLGAGTGTLAASLDYIDLRDPQWAYYKPKTP